MTVKKQVGADIIEILGKCKDDFLYYAPRCLEITGAGGGGAQSFIPLAAQLEVHRRLEKQRKERGYVRAVILKGRQMGISTYCQGRALWKTQFLKGYSSVIIANNSKTAGHVYGMLRGMHNGIPGWMPKPENIKNNYNEMLFSNNSGVQTLSAESSDAGRGLTIQYLHASEVAAWGNEEAIVTALLPGIHAEPETEIILESTPKGAQGFFYRMAMNAHHGKSDYELIFLPWFWHKGHARKPPADWSVAEGDLPYMREHNLTIDQMYFRHLTIVNSGSVNRFRQEFPATVEEAFAADVEGALWTRDDIKHVSEFPEMKRTVIGVDPATTAKKNSDSTGIILAGLGMDDKVYVMQDSSGKMKVEEWARKVIEIYHRHNVDKIVAESNQGGDMVTHAIRSVDPTANVMGKHVSVSKVARHEPVSALYRQGKVRHVEGMSDLEDQMCMWNPITHPKDSPDRVDALTLALGELMLAIRRPAFLI